MFMQRTQPGIPVAASLVQRTDTWVVHSHTQTNMTKPAPTRQALSHLEDLAPYPMRSERLQHEEIFHIRTRALQHGCDLMLLCPLPLEQGRPIGPPLYQAIR